MAIRNARLSGLAVTLFGAGFLLYNLKYPLDTWGNPGPGVFPMMAGIMLVVLAAWELAREFLRPAVQRNEESGGQRASLREAFRVSHGARKIFLTIVVFVLYILMIRWIGFFVSNFFFVIIASRLAGARSWGAPVALSAGVNVFCYSLFDLWLKLSLPRGFLF